RHRTARADAVAEGWSSAAAGGVVVHRVGPGYGCHAPDGEREAGLHADGHRHLSRLEEQSRARAARPGRPRALQRLPRPRAESQKRAPHQRGWRPGVRGFHGRHRHAAVDWGIWQDAVRPAAVRPGRGQGGSVVTASLLLVVQAAGAQYPLAPSPVLDLKSLTRELRLSGYVSARETLRRDTLTFIVNRARLTAHVLPASFAALRVQVDFTATGQARADTIPAIVLTDAYIQ